MPFRNSKRRELLTILIVAVMVGLLTAGVGGFEPWVAGCVMAAVLVAFFVARVVGRRKAAADEKARRDIRLDENNRCKRCNGDLWGLDVKPGSGGKFQVKCAECGAVNEIARPKRRKAAEPPKKDQLEDRGPFKFPG